MATAPLGFLDLCQFRPKAGAGKSATMKIRDMDVFIRAVKIVRVSAPAEQKSIDSQNLFEAENDWNGTTLADQNRRLSKGCFHSLARGRQPVAGRIKDEGFTTVRSLEFEFNSRWTIRLQKFFKSIQNFIDVNDNRLDYWSAFVDMTTNYYTHTGTQTLARRIIERAVNEI